MGCTAHLEHFIADFLDLSLVWLPKPIVGFVMGCSLMADDVGFEIPFKYAVNVSKPLQIRHHSWTTASDTAS